MTKLSRREDIAGSVPWCLARTEETISVSQRNHRGVAPSGHFFAARFWMVIAMSFTCGGAGAEAFASDAADVFVVKPYLQLGAATQGAARDLTLDWQSEDVDAAWTLTYSVNLDRTSQIAKVSPPRLIAVAGVSRRRAYRVRLNGLVLCHG